MIQLMLLHLFIHAELDLFLISQPRVEKKRKFNFLFANIALTLHWKYLCEANLASYQTHSIHFFLQHQH